MKYTGISNRRKFLHTAGILGLSLGMPAYVKAEGPTLDPYEGLKTRRYLGKVKVVTRIVDEKIFTEGPAVDANGHVYFTNVPMEKILKWDTDQKILSVFRKESKAANGLRFTTDGDLLVCEGSSGKVTRTNMKTGEISVLAASYKNKRLQSPNDIEFDSTGRIYFSSRTGNPDLEKENLRAVYRVDPDGTVHQLLAEPQVHMPNGLLISPDEKTFYLIEADGGKDRHRSILAFDLQPDGSLSNQRTLYDFYPGRSGDGMCIDAAGNLYVAAGLHKTRNSSETLDTRPGIHVISPQGELLAYRETPEDTITNCTFGGKDLKTLYVTCGSYLLRIRTKIPGKLSYRPVN